MNFVAKEKILLTLGSPFSISIGEASRTIAFSFTFTGFITELIGISPDMSGVDGRITTLDYFKDNGLSNQVMEDFIEGLIPQTVTEISKGTIGRGLEKI